MNVRTCSPALLCHMCGGTSHVSETMPHKATMNLLRHPDPQPTRTTPHLRIGAVADCAAAMIKSAHRGPHGAVQREGGVLARLVHALLVQVADVDLDAAVVLRRDQLVGPRAADTRTSEREANAAARHAGSAGWCLLYRQPITMRPARRAATGNACCDSLFPRLRCSPSHIAQREPLKGYRMTGRRGGDSIDNAAGVVVQMHRQRQPVGLPAHGPAGRRSYCSTDCDAAHHLRGRYRSTSSPSSLSMATGGGGTCCACLL